MSRMRARSWSRILTATDIADWLVRRLGMPFRQAHHVTGRVVALASSRGVELDALTLSDLQSIDDGFTADVLSARCRKSRSRAGPASAALAREREAPGGCMAGAPGEGRLKALAATGTCAGARCGFAGIQSC